MTSKHKPPSSGDESAHWRGEGDAILGTSPSLEVLVDLSRGGCIRSLAHRDSGIDLLFQTGWAHDAAVAPAAAHESWVDQWPGGWHALFPNAGEACTAHGRAHPFHGAASTARWTVERCRGHELVTSWAGTDRLRIRRRLRLDGARLAVATTVENGAECEEPFVLVEHIVFAGDAFGPEFEVVLPAALLEPLADDGTPLGDADQAGCWPYATLAGGGEEDWHTRPSEPTSRFGTLRNLRAREARIKAAGPSLFVHLTWSSSFPYLWYWEEYGGIRSSPWNGRTSCLGIEPATCVTSQGLDRAIGNGDAVMLAPGETASFEVTLRIEHGIDEGRAS